FTTFGGEALSLAAARATLRELREKDVPALLARQGRKLKEGYERLARDRGLDSHAVGADCRSLVPFSSADGDPLLQKSLLQQELLRQGVLWSGFHNLCFAHTDADIEHVLRAYERALDVLADAAASGGLERAIRGRPVQPIFRKTR
ncbi:MAG TPA: hypothetical protein VG963_14975, partial [Polyangiaceae bacterium]|nr:hypothetical protein [Polyangiaceae bacterium]